MTSKSYDAYLELLRFIDVNICKLNPKAIMSDYEVASRKAFKTLYPECVSNGCYFHFKQAVRKRSSFIPGFLVTLVKDDVMNRLFHKFMALPLLPSRNIVLAFTTLKSEAEKFGDVFAVFLQYFEKQWIKMVYCYLFVIFTVIV